MIIDTIDNLGKYKALNPLFSKAVEFIESHDLMKEEIGKISIQGTDLVINLQQTQPKTKEMAKLEAHKDFIDIQMPLSDEEIERIGSTKKDSARRELALELVEKLYKKKEKEFGAELIRGIEREVYLQVLDTLWMQHLENMQHLREGIHWRSVGQRDPLVEYRAESQKLFDSLQSTLREEVLRAIYHVHRTDAITREAVDDDHETELTKLAENSVERGVNEIMGGEENRDKDFGKVQKAATAADTNRKRNVARKKKKAQRQNRKKSR